MPRDQPRLVRSDVSLRERAAGAGFQIALKARSLRLVWELDRHEHTPRPMLKRIAVRSCVMPIEPLIDIRRTSDVVSRRVAFAPKDVNEPGACSTHTTPIRTFEAVEGSERFRKRSFGSDAVVRNHGVHRGG